jgi:hypothetical protein
MGLVAMDSNINWDEVIDKKARGIDDCDLGEVQEVNDNVVITQKGILDTYRGYIEWFDWGPSILQVC